MSDKEEKKEEGKEKKKGSGAAKINALILGASLAAPEMMLIVGLPVLGAGWLVKHWIDKADAKEEKKKKEKKENAYEEALSYRDNMKSLEKRAAELRKRLGK